MTLRSALRAFKLLIFILARASSSLSPLALAALTARDPIFNRGLATPDADRQRRGIHGLLPKRIRTFERQEEAALAELRALPDPISQYKYLQSLQNVDERLYFALIAKHTAELMPLIYTPTVGEACVKWSSMLGGSLQPRGLYISLEDLGNVRSMVDNWPRDDVKVIVFTDGERILGLGDLGANGMGIPIGKLALYTACAGIDPSCCLPVVLDVGTNTDAVRDDPFYIGLPRERERGAAYDALVDEFVEAARGRFGKGVLLQFEDFGNSNAFRLLDRYADRCCCFNDDIQGTAAVALAGILASCRAGRGEETTAPLADQTFLFAGAGEAGVGIANLLASAIAAEVGCSDEEARSRIWLTDSRGLVTAARQRAGETLAHHKIPYAHEAPTTDDADGEDASGEHLLRAVKLLKPTALIGVSAQAGIFTEAVCREMVAGASNSGAAPLLVFALSNPTSKAECTAAQAYEWTDGKALFASGSPFDPVTLKDGTTRIPGQGNNAYIFPALGLAAVAVGARRMTDDDMLVAARALANEVTEDRLEVGCLYPPLADIRTVSARIAAAVAENVYARGDAELSPRPDDLLAHCRSCMWSPHAT